MEKLLEKLSEKFPARGETTEWDGVIPYKTESETSKPRTSEMLTE